jgi:hypothetical protein
MEERSYRLQVFFSLLVAAVIVAVTIAVVTVEFGPTPAAELEIQEERMKQREEAREERRELREERLKELE